MKRFLLAIFLCSIWPIVAIGAEPQGPGIEALRLYRQGLKRPPVVQNRFAVKSKRFETGVAFGYVPNNAFAQRFMGTLSLGYHFSETLSTTAHFTWAPDMGQKDLKGLTRELVSLTHDPSFQQPLSKLLLSFSAGAEWAPVYGKISLIGERIINYDFFLSGGVHMGSAAHYTAQMGDRSTSEMNLNKMGQKAIVGPALGLGSRVFVGRNIALTLGLRSLIYVDKAPQYDVDAPPSGSRVYTDLVMTSGISLFFPRVQSRSNPL